METITFDSTTEFIAILVSGTKLGRVNNKSIHYYDPSGKYANPFRVTLPRLGSRSNDCDLTSVVGTIFTIIEPEPVSETRWRMLKDNDNGTTALSYYYVSQEVIDNAYKGSWYKSNDSIQVQV